MFISHSTEETFSCGVRAAAEAHTGDVFALIGDLGAGKTQFVKGFVNGIGSDVEVTSPTFTLLHEYAGGRAPVYHFDFYRLDNAAAVLGVGFDEYAFGDGVCLIEWADRFRELIPQNARWLQFRVAGENERTIEELNAP